MSYAGTIYPASELLADPFPFYRWLRDESPVYEVPERGEYLVARHADVLRVLDDPETFSSAFARQPEKTGRPADVLESDPPRHTEEKRLVMTGLKPSRVKGHLEAISAVVNGLIDGIADGGEVAFVERVASRLPVHVFAAVFGLPPEDLWEIHASAPYLGPARRYLPEAERQADIARSFVMFDYLGERIKERYENPRGDLLSEMIARQIARDGAFNFEEMQAEVDIMFIGGLTTTPHLLVNALRILGHHPDVMARVRADPSLIPQALDETFRVESPVQWVPRETTADVEVAGTVIPRGARTLAVLGSANRDERVFQDPEKYDIDRPQGKEHVGLGHGIHFCVGAPLARLETTVMLETMFSRLGSIRLSASNDFAPYPGLHARSLHELRLDIEARAA